MFATFDGCTNLESIVIPADVTSLSISDCPNLTSITFKGTVEELKTRNWASDFDNIPATEIICSDGTFALS